MNSIAAVYANDSSGTSLVARRVTWDNFQRLQDDRVVVGIYVYWDQNPPDPPNRVSFTGHECYCIRRTPPGQGGAAQVEVTWCDGAGGPLGSASAKDTSMHDDGVTARQKNWPAKLIQAAMAGPVRLLAFDWSHPSYATVEASARALADATPVEM